MSKWNKPLFIKLNTAKFKYLATNIKHKVKGLKKSLLCIWILPLLFIGTAMANSTEMAVDPQLYTADNIGVIFQVNVTIQDVTNLAGYEFKLGYDTTVLTATLIEYGGIFGPTYFELISTINDAEGWVGYGCMEMFGEPEFTGSGVLATITFSATEEGSCALDLYDTKAGDAAAAPIEHTVMDGDVTVIPEFPLFMIAPLFLAVTLAAVILRKIVWSKKRRGPFVAT